MEHWKDRMTPYTGEQVGTIVLNDDNEIRVWIAVYAGVSANPDIPRNPEYSADQAVRNLRKRLPRTS